MALSDVDASLLTFMDETQTTMDTVPFAPPQGIGSPMPPPPSRPPTPTPTSSKVTKRKCKKKLSAAAAAATIDAGGWKLKKVTEAPAVTWTDNCFQYSVENPANRGNMLLKMQVFRDGRPTHNSGVYLDYDGGEMCTSLADITDKLENVWVDRNTGAPKIGGLEMTVAPLPAWRRTLDDCNTPAAAVAGRGNRHVRSGGGDKAAQSEASAPRPSQ